MKLKSLLSLSSLIVFSWSVGACNDDNGGDSDGGTGGGASGGRAGDGDGDGDDEYVNGGSGAGGVDEDIESVTITFRAQVGDELFKCGEKYADQGSTEVEVTPQDFRFYVSDLRLIDEDGEEVPLKLNNRSPWQSPHLTLLDFEDGTEGCKNGNSVTNTTVTGTVPRGNYVGLVFSPAVPPALNHEDPATLPDPLQAGGMTWGWLYGYKFIVAEMAATAMPEEGQEPGAGLFHLGSTGCDNTPAEGEGGAGGAGGAGAVPDFGAPPTVECSQQNRTEIRIADGFSIEEDVIVADIGAMMKDADLSTSFACHSGGEFCDAYFESVGLDFATSAQLGEQTVFRVENK